MSTESNAGQEDFTAKVVARLQALNGGSLPAGAIVLAKQCIMDWFAVAIAGADEPLVRILVAQALEDGCHPASTVVNQRSKFSARQAALINGAMGHALDYDDVNVAGHGHLTAAILPSLLAAAEREKICGAKVLRAFIVGYEAAVMIGKFIGREHYECGFHATVTVGSYGSAAAVAALLDLDVEATARALGIAGTQAAGLKAQFGTMCKPFHAGKSNENGIVAAYLARRGFTGRTDILECSQGFGATQSPRVNPQAALELSAGGAHIMTNLFKYSAACYGTHGAIVATENLRRKHGLTPDMIRHIDIKVEPGADRMCNISNPRTGLEAKFSIKFNTALAVHGEDTSSVDLYCDEITKRVDLCAMANRVRVHCMGAGWSLTRTEVAVETADGLVYADYHDTGIPAEDLELQGQRLQRKFLGLVTPGLGNAKAAELSRAIYQFDQIDDLESLLALVG